MLDDKIKTQKERLFFNFKRINPKIVSRLKLMSLQPLKISFARANIQIEDSVNNLFGKMTEEKYLQRY